MKRIILVLAISYCTLVSAQNLQISGGNSFSAVVCAQRIVNLSGSNSSGQLGVDATGTPRAFGTFVNTWTPVTRGNLSATISATAPDVLPAIRQVDAGSGNHVLGLDCNKQVWAWGQNDLGQLGRNTTGAAISDAVPMRVLRGAQVIGGGDPNFLSRIISVSGGNNSSFAIEEGGRVLAWGSNDYGQLGDGTVINRSTPVYVQRSAAEGGGPLTNIVQIEGGDDFTVALDANGNVWTWGVTFAFGNPARNLGRDRSTEVNAALGAPNKCIPVAGRVLKGTNNNDDGANIGLLDNIIQISGGDAHTLALDNRGNVWSFGGDWAPGQLGQGNGGQYTDKAGRVVGIGVTTPTGPFLGSQNNVYKAVYVSAGQSSSAIVLVDTTDRLNINKNRVVTFGSNGLYNFNGITTQSGVISCTPANQNNRFSSGTLGRGSCAGPCTQPAGGVQNENTDATSYEYPQFVLTGPGTPLTGVSQISDGDGWYFATNDIGGNAVAWGWNRRGELANSSYADNCYASSLTLPTGCAFDYPCPSSPSLTNDFASCPIFSTILNSQVAQDYTTYKYQWYYRIGTSANGVGTNAWTLVEGTITPSITGDSSVNRVGQIGQYKVEIRDSRANVAFLCGPCPVQRDSMTITERPNPYTVTGCADVGSSKGKFDIITPTTSKIKWYTNLTGGTALNPTDSALTITTGFANTNTTIPGCSRALFAEDLATSQGVLRNAASLAAAPCGGATTITNNDGKREPIKLSFTKSVRIVSLGFIQPGYNYDYTASYELEVFNAPNNTPPAQGSTAWSFKSGSTSFTNPQNTGPKIRSIVINQTFAPGDYWFRISGGESNYFGCTNPASTGGLWNTPEASTPAAISIVTATRDGNVEGRGTIININFETGTGYTCGRVLVCATNTCTLPVEFVKFDIKKNANLVTLNWATSYEENATSFKILRSINGKDNFEQIGEIQATGNSQVVKEYSFVDQVSKAGGTYYYMIVETDVNGKETTTDIKSINVNFQNSEINVVPNPNNGNFMINAKLGEQKAVSLRLYNSVGQEVYSDTESSGTFNKNVSISQLTSGIYFLHIIGENEKWIEKIIKD